VVTGKAETRRDSWSRTHSAGAACNRQEFLAQVTQWHILETVPAKDGRSTPHLTVSGLASTELIARWRQRLEPVITAEPKALKTQESSFTCGLQCLRCTIKREPTQLVISSLACTSQI